MGKHMHKSQLSIAENIKTMIWRTVFIVTCSVLMNMVVSYYLTKRYDQLITNVEYTSSLRDTIEKEVPESSWYIVCGSLEFSSTYWTSVSRTTYDGFIYLQTHATTPQADAQLEVARRTMHTLESYIQKLGEGVAQGASVDDLIEINDQIRDISLLVGELLQEFVFFEIQAAAELNDIMGQVQSGILLLDGALILMVCWMMWRNKKKLIRNIKDPIQELEDFAGKVSEGQFDVRAKESKIEELYSLSVSLNQMAMRIQKLINENNKEHDNLKKAELQLLQEQIKPHFLYNTYDTIIWLLEKGNTEDAIKVIEALTQFHRIALSSGNEWITLKDEITHIESYLIIQRFRYGHILTYSICIEPELESLRIPKLILQPVVENALYHGVKHLRKEGEITITAHREKKYATIRITDTGAGMHKDKLAMLQEQLHTTAEVQNQTAGGFGLANIYQRLRLYFGEKVDFFLASELGKGTTVMYRLPLPQKKD